MAFDDLQLTRVENIDDVLDFKAWLGERRPILAVDIETSGLNVGCDRIRLFQVGDGQRGWALDWEDWRGACRETLSSYDRPLVFHNALFDLTFLKRDGLPLPQRLIHDTLIMLFMLNPAGGMALKPAATRYVDRRAAAGQGWLEEVMSANGWTWDTVPTDCPAYWQYGVLDTCLTALLAEKIWPEVSSAYRYAYELELAFIHVLRDAELTGMLVDEDTRLRTAAKLEREIAELTPQIPVRNPGSDQQVIKYLRDIGAGQYLIFKTDKGNTSVDKHALRYVAAQGYPVAELIERWRSRTRTLGNYIEKFATVHDGGLADSNHVLHAKVRPVGARTGRTSITDPPLQTLPRGRVVRDCIVARPGTRFLMADFAGMEMRALASLAHEETMLAAYARGEDMHNFVSEQVYGPGFTKQQRSTAKNAGFAKIYGAGVPQFAATAGIPIPEAQAFLDKYDEMFPGVGRFMDQMIGSIEQQCGGRRNGWGFVELQDGRRLPVEGKKAYVSVNYRIQGGTCVTAKEKAVELDAAGLGPFFRLFVHDEFLFEVPEEHAPAAREVIKRVMPDRYSWPGVTLEIDQDEVNRWGQHYRGDYARYVETEDPEWLT